MMSLGEVGFEIMQTILHDFLYLASYCRALQHCILHVVWLSKPRHPSEELDVNSQRLLSYVMCSRALMELPLGAYVR